MNLPKYYPPEMEPNWSGHFCKYFDWYKLGIWLVIILLLIRFWMEMWSWIDRITRGCV